MRVINMKQPWQLYLSNIQFDVNIPFDTEEKIAEALFKHVINVRIKRGSEPRSTIVYCEDIYGNILEYSKLGYQTYNRVKLQIEGMNLKNWKLYYIVSTKENEIKIENQHEFAPEFPNITPKATAENVI